MPPVSIQLEEYPKQARLFRALSGLRQSIGKTPGEALDALIAQEGEIMESSAILIQRFGSDSFFTQNQYDRMQYLLGHNAMLTVEESAELDTLIDAEIEATIRRTDSLVKPLQT